jgi:hypothetical protein
MFQGRIPSRYCIRNRKKKRCKEEARSCVRFTSIYCFPRLSICGPNPPVVQTRVIAACSPHVMMTPPNHSVPLTAPSCDEEPLSPINFGKRSKKQVYSIFAFFFSAVISMENINSSVSPRSRPATAPVVGKRAYPVAPCHDHCGSGAIRISRCRCCLERLSLPH